MAEVYPSPSKYPRYTLPVTISRVLTASSLDLSFNNFRHLPNLPSQTRLRILYLVQNKISAVQAGDLDWCADTLTSIELGGNRLRAIENMEKLVKLEELWLGKNKIRALDVSLRTLRLQHQVSGWHGSRGEHPTPGR